MINLPRHSSLKHLKYLSPAKTHSNPSILVMVTRIWTEVPYMLLRISNIKEQDRRCRLDMSMLSIKARDVLGRRMVTREFFIKILDTREST